MLRVIRDSIEIDTKLKDNDMEKGKSKDMAWPSESMHFTLQLASTENSIAPNL